MSGERNMLTLEVLFNTSLENEQHIEETGCTSCIDFHQEHSNIDIVKTVKLKEKCCKRYERKKKSHCKRCPEGNRGVA